MLTLLFADPAESRAFRRRPRDLSPGEIALAHTGIGPERAASALREHLRATAPSAVFSAGFAAGLRGDLAAGRLILGLPWSDPGWAERVAAAGAGAAPVRLASASAPLLTPEAKRAFARATGAEAADMETEALAAICSEAGLPFLSLRIVSDGPDEGLPRAFAAAGAVPAERPVARAARFLLAALASPGEWPLATRQLARLPRFSAALAEAVEAAVATAPGKG